MKEIKEILYQTVRAWNTSSDAFKKAYGDDKDFFNMSVEFDMPFCKIINFLSKLMEQKNES